MKSSLTPLPLRTSLAIVPGTATSQRPGGGGGSGGSPPYTAFDAAPLKFSHSSFASPASTTASSPGSSVSPVTQRSPDLVAGTAVAFPSASKIVTSACSTSPASSQSLNEQVKQYHSSCSGSPGAAGSRNAVR